MSTKLPKVNIISMGSKRFQLDREDLKKIWHVFIWCLLSASVAGTIAIFSSPDVQIPAWLVPLVPAINAFLYGLKRWTDDNR